MIAVVTRAPVSLPPAATTPLMNNCLTCCSTRSAAREHRVRAWTVGEDSRFGIPQSQWNLEPETDADHVEGAAGRHLRLLRNEVKANRDIVRRILIVFEKHE